MHHMKDKEERVYLTEMEVHRKQGKILVGHTQNYSKVTLPFEEGLIGKQVIVRFTETSKWHVSGVIIDRDPPAKEVDPHFFDGLKKKYEEINARKKAELLKRKKERRARLKALRIKAQE